MRDIVITTDFSDSAMNAAKYAAALAKPLGVEKIILYHSFGNNLSDTDIPEDQLEIASTPPDILSSLKRVGQELRDLLDSEVEVELVSNGLTLKAGIDQLAVERQPSFVVIGATGKSSMQQVFVGSNTLNLASENIAPLLIIPKDASFTPIEKLVFACDLTQVSTKAPVEDIRLWLERLKSQLLVFNVVEEGKHFDSENLGGFPKLKDLLDEFAAEYHYSENKSVANEIANFSKEHQAGLIITIPKLHGLLENLFRRSVSKQLIKKSTIPVLVLRDGQ